MSLTADGRLLLVRVKIERAKKHLGDLEAAIIESRGKHSYIVIRDVNKPVGGVSLGGPPVTKVGEVPVDVISIAGDVVHNLRSALDHLAYQLAVTGTPGKEPSRRVEFPIAKDATTYEAEKARKLEGIRPDTVKVIDALKPYKGGNDAIWRIHELDNIDKHRAHFSVGHEYLLFGDWMPTGYLVRNAGSPHFDGTEGFDPDVQQNIQLEVEKALGDPQVTQGNALLPIAASVGEFRR